MQVNCHVDRMQEDDEGVVIRRTIPERRELMIYFKPDGKTDFGYDHRSQKCRNQFLFPSSVTLLVSQDGMQKVGYMLEQRVSSFVFDFSKICHVI